MKVKVNSTELVFMAICLAMGIVCKRIISPLTNIITDFIRLPGGGAASAFSIMFLVLGTSFTRWKPAAAICSVIQAFLALSLGMSTSQGIYALVTYTGPGIVTDIIRMIYPVRDKFYFIIAIMLANVSGAFLSSLLVFHFRSALLTLWLLVAACFGVIAGVIGGEVERRLRAVNGFREMRNQR